MSLISQIGRKAVSFTHQYTDETFKYFCRQPKPVNTKNLQIIGLAKDTVSLTKVPQNFASKIKELSLPGKESSTLKKLFSPEFKAKRRFDENGYFVTTVIDKKTQKPVEIFIKEVRDNKFEFYKKVNNEYEFIGRRTFSVNKELGIIEQGFMVNRYKDEFTGIGIRGHQLAVEKVIKNNLKDIHVDSLPKAETFHEKCLFRPLTKKNIAYSEIKEYIDNLSEALNIPIEKVKKLVVLEKAKTGYIMDLEQTTINLNKIISQKDPKNIINHPTMGMYSLSGERLELWKNMVRSQPITL